MAKNNIFFIVRTNPDNRELVKKELNKAREGNRDNNIVLLIKALQSFNQTRRK